MGSGVLNRFLTYPLKFKAKYFSCLGSVFILFAQCTGNYLQPELEARQANIIKEGKYHFKDLNKNKELDPYEDWQLTDKERISNLVSLMNLEEKVGLMFHPNIAVTPDGKLIYEITDELRQSLEGKGYGSQTGQTLATATAKEYIEQKNFRCILNNGVAEPSVFASWSNSMQEIAESTRLGIPIMFSSDPRHGATLGGHLTGTQYFSQWPGIEGQYGITASRNVELVKKYGEITAEEYRAVGLHMILGPQIDVTTEPRWRRNAGSFSESAELTAQMLEAYMDGAQGPEVGPGKILVMLKHWPGAGPHKDGQGDWLVYPGNNLEYHLIPWKTGISKGALAVMGYYSGTYYDTLGVNFSKYISTELLYDRLDFKGSICTDWFVIGRKGALRNDLIGIPLIDRYEISINAGVDQFGGEVSSEFIIQLVNEGRIPESRIDLAVSRILQWHFKLGLFEDPYVDPDAAAEIVKNQYNQKFGYQAQLESVVMLSNKGVLPFMPDSVTKIYVSGIDIAAASAFGKVVKDAGEADIAVLMIESLPVSGSAKEEINIELPEVAMKMVRSISAIGIPTIVAVNVGGPLEVLSEELFTLAEAVFMTFDIQNEALLDIVFGRFNPVGKLPFELPSSMDAVREQLEDVPFDSHELFEFGYGLSYSQ